MFGKFDCLFTILKLIFNFVSHTMWECAKRWDHNQWTINMWTRYHRLNGHTFFYGFSTSIFDLKFYRWNSFGDRVCHGRWMGIKREESHIHTRARQVWDATHTKPKRQYENICICEIENYLCYYCGCSEMHITAVRSCVYGYLAEKWFKLTIISTQDRTLAICILLYILLLVMDVIFSFADENISYCVFGLLCVCIACSLYFLLHLE